MVAIGNNTRSRGISNLSNKSNLPSINVASATPLQKKKKARDLVYHSHDYDIRKLRGIKLNP